MKSFSICMIGFGNVGKAFAQLITRKTKQIADEYNTSLKVVAIATGSHGQAIDHSGINLKKALEISAENGTLDELSVISTPESIQDFIALSKADFLLEISPVNYASGEPAITHIKTALANNMHAVSANKGPVVHEYNELTALARESGKQFLFESSSICLVGGLIGLLLSYGVTSLINKLLMPASVSLGIAVVAISVSIFVGVISGIIPAFRASRLDPIEALRYE